MSETWHFPLSNHTTSLGLAGSGTDQFSNNPINNLAREVIQNSLDARQAGKQVNVEFHLFRTSNQDLPGVTDLGGYVLKLYNQLKKNPDADPKEKNFVNKTLSMLNASQMAWLNKE